MEKTIFETLKNIDNFEDLVKKGINLAYLSRPECGVCTAVKSKIQIMLERDFPKTKAYYIDMNEVPESAGHFSVFTIPAIIIYVDGKESLRVARYFSIDEIKTKLSRIYDLYFE